MYISFGRRLKSLGRIRFGFRMKGSTAWIFAIFYGMFYLCWYMILACLWLMYGMCYLFFYLPIKLIIKCCKAHKASKETTHTNETINDKQSNG